MAYRETPKAPPLVLALRHVILALDAETGARIWELQLGDSPQRLLVAGERLFVVCGTSVITVGLHTGEQLDRVELPFEATAALSQGQALYLAGSHGAACISTDGRVLWSAVVQTVDHGLFKESETALVGLDSWGQELWRTAPGPAYIGEAPGLLLGSTVAQPELDRW